MDKRKGIASAIIVLIFVLLYLAFYNIKMADPKPEPMITTVETEIPQELLLQNLLVEGGMDSGNPNDQEVKPPEPVTQEVATQANSDTQISSGQATATTTNNSQNTDSNTEQTNDPFASGGQNGGTGTGTTFGQSENTGPGGPGGGGGVKRVRITNPNFGNISTENATIALIVTVDASGNVVSAKCNKAATTTSSQMLINNVISEVIKSVKYNKDPGATLVNLTLTLKVTAQ